MGILYAVLTIGILAFILGAALEFASKKFAIKKDERLSELEKIMPGVNCGGCGYAGCSAYAAAVASGEAKIGKCAPGGKALALSMATIMGVDEISAPEKQVAFVACRGDVNHTQLDAKYDGILDCRAASLLFNGNKGCKAGCLHFGSCAAECPHHAIYTDAEGNYIVDKNKCVGCGVCVTVCPHKIIRLIPYDAEYAVACNNTESGLKVRKVCEKGCIGCKICVNKHPDSGCEMKEDLSVVNYSRDTSGLEKAALSCPRKIIVKL